MEFFFGVFFGAVALAFLLRLRDEKGVGGSGQQMTNFGEQYKPVVVSVPKRTSGEGDQRVSSSWGDDEPVDAAQWLREQPW